MFEYVEPFLQALPRRRLRRVQVVHRGDERPELRHFGDVCIYVFAALEPDDGHAVSADAVTGRGHEQLSGWTLISSRRSRSEIRPPLHAASQGGAAR